MKRSDTPVTTKRAAKSNKTKRRRTKRGVGKILFSDLTDDEIAKVMLPLTFQREWPEDKTK